MNTQQNPATVIKKIERRSNISHEELLEEYILPSIPVVLTADATQDWKAIGKLTPDFFRTRYSHFTKEINGVTYTMPEYIDIMMDSTPENPAPYPFNFNLKKCPELFKYIKPELIYAKSDRVNSPLLLNFLFRGTEVYELFLGGNGSRFPYLHIDALFLHTQITQIYGSKDFILYPPEQAPYMYPNKDNDKVSQVDIFNPDFERFPLFKKATPIKVTVNEGETILFPTKWWHTTMIHEPCISLGRAHLNDANWDDFVSDNFKFWKKHISSLAILPWIYVKIVGQLFNILEKSK